MGRLANSSMLPVQCVATGPAYAFRLCELVISNAGNLPLSAVSNLRSSRCAGKAGFRAMKRFRIVPYGIDQSSLSRMFPEHTTGDLRQALHMYQAQGVFRRKPEGSADVYSLDPEFCCHSELRAFLNKILNTWPNYRARTAQEERYMTPRRLQMRKNARKMLTPTSL